MPYIYKFENCQTGDVEYVGISKDFDRMKGRIRRHRDDIWYAGGAYEVYYAEAKTRTDAECLEAHFIHKYKPRYNTAKTTWGTCTFAPDIEWTVCSELLQTNRDKNAPLAVQSQNQVPLMVTCQEASRLTGISYDALRRWCIAGKIVHIYAGKKRLINFQKLLEYLNEGGQDDNTGND